MPATPIHSSLSVSYVGDTNPNTGALIIPTAAQTFLWSSTATYELGEVVTFNGVGYFCKIEGSTNQQPDQNPTIWEAMASPSATSSSPGTVQLPAGQTSNTLATVAITGSYNDLTNKPAAGGSVSPATSSAPGVVQLASGQTSSTLSTVATSGSYADLTNKPTIPTVSPASSSQPGIVELPVGQSSTTLSTVAITGKFSDLVNAPTITSSATLVSSILTFGLNFAAAGAQTVTHNLNTLKPVFNVYVNSGSTRFTVNTVDVNTVSVSTLGPSNITLVFLNPSVAPQQTVNTPYAVQIPTSGLVEYWQMTEGSGTSIANSASSGNAATATNCTWGSSSGYTSGTALGFNGTSSGCDAAESESSSQFDMRSQAFSLSCWVNPTAYPSSGQDSFFFYNSNIIFGIRDNGSLFLWVRDSSLNRIGFVGTNWTIPAGSISNVGIVYNGAGSIGPQSAPNVQFFYNGSEPLNAYGPDTDSINATTVGTTPWSFGYQYNGYMGGLAIYNRALSSADISTIYSKGAP